MNETREELTGEISEMLRGIISAFTDHGDELVIQTTQHPGATYWKLKANADDQGKIVGRQGAHIKALKFLVEEAGEIHGFNYRLTLLEPDHAPRRVEAPARTATGYDPEPARLLLEKTVETVTRARAKVTVADISEQGASRFLFTVIFPSSHECEAFDTPYEGDPSGMTARGVLETLWKAYANKEGTHFRIETRAA